MRKKQSEEEKEAARQKQAQKGTGEEGIELLKESVQVTESLGIVYADRPIQTAQIHPNTIYRNSCTVLINGENVCIRDGEWRDCEVC